MNTPRQSANRERTITYLKSLYAHEISDAQIRRVLLAAGICVGHTCPSPAHPIGQEKYHECLTVSCCAIQCDVVCCAACKKVVAAKASPAPLTSEQIQKLREKLSPAQFELVMSLRKARGL